MKKAMIFKSFDEMEAWIEQFEECSEYQMVPTAIDDGWKISADMFTECKSWKTALRRFEKAFGDLDPCISEWVECMRESCESGCFADWTGWKPAWTTDQKAVKEVGKQGTYSWAVEGTVEEGSWYICLNISGVFADRKRVEPEKRYSAGTIKEDGTEDFYWDTQFTNLEEAEAWGIEHGCTHTYDTETGTFKAIIQEPESEPENETGEERVVDVSIESVTRAWKVYGMDGHRQALSFGESQRYDWSTDHSPRILEIEKADRTGSNEYVIVRITRRTAKECEWELEGQLFDGLFENLRFGEVVEI